MGQQEPAGAVFGPFEQMWSRILDFLPNLAAGALIVLLGLVVCWLLKKILVRAVLLLRLDRPLRNFRWARGLTRADVRNTVANLTGNVAAAAIFLIFLENALIVWRVEVLSQLIGGLVFYLPRLVVGALVLSVGAAIAAAAAARVRLGLAVEGFAQAGLASRLTYWALMIVVAAVTLEELRIAPQTVQAAFKIGLGSIGLAVVLAVGLGSRDAVARLWQSNTEKPPQERT